MSNQLHKQLIETAVAMNASGINRGTSGNLSVRTDEGFLITPSGMDYESLAPEDIVAVNLEGDWEGSNKPSSEWRFHLDVYRSREDAHAIVHAQLSDYAVAALEGRKACLMAHHGLLCLERDLPRALALAIEVEGLAQIYYQCLLAGEPTVLDDAEMDRVLEKFKDYGKRG